MIFSQNLIFSDKQVVLDTVLSSSFIDLGERDIEPATGNTARGDLGAGGFIPVAVNVTEDFDGVTSVAVELIQSDTLNAAGDALVSPEVVDTTPPILAADLVAGYRFNMDSLRSGVTKRYIQLNYVVDGSGTEGKIMAGIVASVPAG